MCRLDTYPLPTFSLALSNFTFSPALIFGCLSDTTAWKAIEKSSEIEKCIRDYEINSVPKIILNLKYMMNPSCWLVSIVTESAEGGWGLNILGQVGDEPWAVL